MKTRCCIPPPGSVQCQDCPLTTPMYGEGTKFCRCNQYPHTEACMKDESYRTDPSLYVNGSSTKEKT